MIINNGLCRPPRATNGWTLEMIDGAGEQGQSTTAALLAVLGRPSTSQTAISLWRDITGDKDANPTIKNFKDIAYHSVASKGLSLQYEPEAGAKNQEESQWTCRAIDIYNHDAGIKDWGAFPFLPICLPVVARGDLGPANAHSLDIEPSTTGARLVAALGEPARKGGGEALRGGGASGLGPPAWMEWNMRLQRDADVNHSVDSEPLDVKLMIQLAGPEARGPLRWEKDKGGAARWGVMTLYL